jgi:hypothetical protein
MIYSGNIKIKIIYHSMGRPQVAVGGEGLQIWWVGANILKKQSRTAEEALSSGG